MEIKTPCSFRSFLINYKETDFHKKKKKKKKRWTINIIVKINIIANIFGNKQVVLIVNAQESEKVKNWSKVCRPCDVKLALFWTYII